ncbi:MAG: PQQ-dependent sugar dehydrogenase [Acidimicrobiia bacterium]|nr:PQQ-dependent sugar dehydrogenase [Acidimicrobiia bacterium]
MVDDWRKVTLTLSLVMLACGSTAGVSLAQQAGSPATAAPQPGRELGAQPQPTDVDRMPDSVPPVTSIGHTFKVTPIKGLSRPFSMAFVPDGSILVTERAGRLRVVRNGVLDPKPIAGIPDVLDTRLKGLQDIALHPRFSENRLIYFTYYKLKPGEKDVATAVLGRARWDGGASLTDVKDVFVSDAWCATPSAARIAFDRDGRTLYLAIGVPIRLNRPGTAQPEDSQNPSNHAGKILRLNDDGSVPADNPFVGREGYKPEIYALGIRNSLGLFVHPQTGELWEHENGPMGGDEINIIRAGKNYGWPVVSYGRAYSGDLTGDTSGPLTPEHGAPGMESPFLFWVPSIAPSGFLFYTGEKFESWKGNLFVGGMRGMVFQRIVLNPKGQPVARESMLTDLKQRIRDIRQSPDGLIYLLTDENHGALLKLEPVGK